MRWAVLRLLAAIGVGLTSISAWSQEAMEATEGYPEKVIQWMVEEGETCAAIADALYGDAALSYLVRRYNDVRCDQALPSETILVVPYAALDVPVARLKSSIPTVRARPPKNVWQTATDGMALEDGYAVNTLDKARANILFRDRTRILLQEQTLVIIYGTASGSQVTATEKLSVQLDEGELRAGIAALRGRPIELETSGGGHVAALSEDTVLRRKEERTTVSVFDGHATIGNAGATVRVNKNFGSAFAKAKPPTDPKPLPPAPAWLDGTESGVRLVNGDGTVELSWSEVSVAVRYRVEVSSETTFSDVLVRQEVPPDVRSIRAENLPPGTYFVRVRAVDSEDFLGIASPIGTISLIGVKPVLGHVQDAGLLLSPYGGLELEAAHDVEVSTNGERFVALPQALDLRTTRPERLWLRRTSDGKVAQFPIEYTQPPMELSAERVATALSIRLTGDELAQLSQRAGLQFHVEQGQVARAVPAIVQDERTLIAAMELAGTTELSVSVLDFSGRKLGSVDVVGEQPVRVAIDQPKPVLGPKASVIPSNRELSFDWWTPRETSGVVGSATAATDGEGGQLSAIARAHLEDFTLALRITSNTLAQSTPSDGSLFGHASYEVALMESLHWAIRSGLVMPAASASPAPRFSAGTAVGALMGNGWSWLSNVDVRTNLSGDTDQLSFWQMRAGAGATYDIASVLRASLLLDGYLLESQLRGAGQFNLELGKTFAGVAGLRWSPWAGDAATWTVGGSLVYRRQ